MARSLGPHKTREVAGLAFGRNRSHRARRCGTLCGETGRLAMVERPSVSKEPPLKRAAWRYDRCTERPRGALKRVDSITGRVPKAARRSGVLWAQQCAARWVGGVVNNAEAASGRWRDEDVESTV